MSGTKKSPIRSVSLLFFCSVALFLAAGCASEPAPAVQGDHPKSYAFWPEAPDEPHIQFLRSFNSSNDVTPGASRFDQLLYGSDRSVVGIQKPYGVRMWNGRIYVCEIRAADSGMLVLDLRKQQARLMGAAGPGTIGKAVDLAIAPDGTKYVLDAMKSGVQVFDPEEHFLYQMPLKGITPGGCAIHNDRLYVTDQKGGKVIVMDRNSGKVIRTIGEQGGEPGQFVRALAITTDSAGNIYVTDTFRDCVSKFSPEGKLLLTFGEAGDRPGNFSRPKGIGVGSDGRIHVVDANLNNVQIFDAEGYILQNYGAFGSHLGSMDLPAGLEVHEGDLDLFANLIHPAFQAERLILVTNQFGGTKISIYAMGRLKEGKTIADIAPARAKVGSGLQSTTQPVPLAPVKPVAPQINPNGAAPRR